jgi:CheY-like chemotaxis protein
MPNAICESLPPGLLIIEDNDEDFLILKRIVEQASISCQIDRCMTGDEAIELLLQAKGNGTLPSLILLDLSLPGTDGKEILDRIKQTHSLSMIPIVALSGDLNQKEVNLLYQMGISGCIVKQVDGIKFKRKMQILIEYWFVANRLPT